MEIWASGVSAPRGIMRVAEACEAGGWDGLGVVDSQNLSGDAFVALAMAATVTERLKLGTAVSNPITRTAATLAAAVASVHSVSKGRAVLGIGRGDSALAHLGRSPARLGQFERYLRHLQCYLGGGHVPFDELTDIPHSSAPPLAALELAEAPDSSHIGWIATTQAGPRKVLVEVAATGPKVIKIAACHAERVMFALGGRTDRIAWGIELAKSARREAGLDPEAIEFGAYVPAACHTDVDTARKMVAGSLTVMARFGIMHGTTYGPLSPESRQVMETLRERYDMREHTSGESAQASALTPAFIDEFAAVGTPKTVIGRLRDLAALGLSKISLTGRSNDPAAAAVGKTLMETEVLPGVRG